MKRKKYKNSIIKFSVPMFLDNTRSHFSLSIKQLKYKDMLNKYKAIQTTYLHLIFINYVIEVIGNSNYSKPTPRLFVKVFKQVISMKDII